MFYYLNVQFQGQRVNSLFVMCCLYSYWSQLQVRTPPPTGRHHHANGVRFNSTNADAWLVNERLKHTHTRTNARTLTPDVDSSTA